MAWRVYIIECSDGSLYTGITNDLDKRITAHNDGLKNGSKFAAAGLQIAAGVPLQCGEGPDYKSFRIGLFGLDKLHNIPRSVENSATALDRVIAN